MNKSEIKAEMEKAIADLEATIPGLESAAATVDLDMEIGRLSRMDALANQEVNKDRLAAAKKKLKALQRNLQVVDSEDFGLCLECGESIPFKRLLAVPESKICVNCARNRE